MEDSVKDSNVQRGILRESILDCDVGELRQKYFTTVTKLRCVYKKLCELQKENEQYRLNAVSRANYEDLQFRYKNMEHQFNEFLSGAELRYQSICREKDATIKLKDDELDALRLELQMCSTESNGGNHAKSNPVKKKVICMKSVISRKSIEVQMLANKLKIAEKRRRYQIKKYVQKNNQLRHEAICSSQHSMEVDIALEKLRAEKYCLGCNNLRCPPEINNVKIDIDPIVVTLDDSNDVGEAPTEIQQMQVSEEIENTINSITLKSVESEISDTYYESDTNSDCIKDYLDEMMIRDILSPMPFDPKEFLDIAIQTSPRHFKNVSTQVFVPLTNTEVQTTVVTSRDADTQVSVSLNNTEIQTAIVTSQDACTQRSAALTNMESQTIVITHNNNSTQSKNIEFANADVQTDLIYPLQVSEIKSKRRSTKSSSMQTETFEETSKRCKKLQFNNTTTQTNKYLTVKTETNEMLSLQTCEDSAFPTCKSSNESFQDSQSSYDILTPPWSCKESSPSVINLPKFNNELLLRRDYKNSLKHHHKMSIKKMKKLRSNNRILKRWFQGVLFGQPGFLNNSLYKRDKNVQKTFKHLQRLVFSSDSEISDDDLKDMDLGACSKRKIGSTKKVENWIRTNKLQSMKHKTGGIRPLHCDDYDHDDIRKLECVSNKNVLKGSKLSNGKRMQSRVLTISDMKSMPYKKKLPKISRTKSLFGSDSDSCTSQTQKDTLQKQKLDTNSFRPYRLRSISKSYSIGIEQKRPKYMDETESDNKCTNQSTTKVTNCNIKDNIFSDGNDSDHSVGSRFSPRLKLKPRVDYCDTRISKVKENIKRRHSTPETFINYINNCKDVGLSDIGASCLGTYLKRQKPREHIISDSEKDLKPCLTVNETRNSTPPKKTNIRKNQVSDLIFNEKNGTQNQFCSPLKIKAPLLSQGQKECSINQILCKQDGSLNVEPPRGVLVISTCKKGSKRIAHRAINPCVSSDIINRASGPKQLVRNLNLLTATAITDSMPKTDFHKNENVFKHVQNNTDSYSQTPVNNIGKVSSPRFNIKLESDSDLVLNHVANIGMKVSIDQTETTEPRLGITAVPKSNDPNFASADLNNIKIETISDEHITNELHLDMTVPETETIIDQLTTTNPPLDIINVPKSSDSNFASDGLGNIEMETIIEPVTNELQLDITVPKSCDPKFGHNDLNNAQTETILDITNSKKSLQIVNNAASNCTLNEPASPISSNHSIINIENYLTSSMNSKQCQKKRKSTLPTTDITITDNGNSNQNVDTEAKLLKSDQVQVCPINGHQGKFTNPLLNLSNTPPIKNSNKFGPVSTSTQSISEKCDVSKFKKPFIATSNLLNKTSEKKSMDPGKSDLHNNSILNKSDASLNLKDNHDSVSQSVKVKELCIPPVTSINKATDRIFDVPVETANLLKSSTLKSPSRLTIPENTEAIDHNVVDAYSDCSYSNFDLPTSPPPMEHSDPSIQPIIIPLERTCDAPPVDLGMDMDTHSQSSVISTNSQAEFNSTVGHEDSPEAITKLDQAYADSLLEKLVAFEASYDIELEITQKFVNEDADIIARAIMECLRKCINSKVDLRKNKKVHVSVAQKKLLGFLFLLKELKGDAGFMTTVLNKIEMGILQSSNETRMISMCEFYVAYNLLYYNIFRVRFFIIKALYKMRENVVAMVHNVLLNWIGVISFEEHSSDSLMVRGLVQIIRLKAAADTNFNAIDLVRLLNHCMKNPIDTEDTSNLVVGLLCEYFDKPDVCRKYIIVMLCQKLNVSVICPQFQKALVKYQKKLNVTHIKNAVDYLDFLLHEMKPTLKQHPIEIQNLQALREQLNKSMNGQAT